MKVILKLLTLLMLSFSVSLTQAASNILDEQLKSTRIIPKYARGGCEYTQLSNNFVLLPLAPENAGITTTPQPSLYWFTSEDIGESLFTVKITNIENENEDPVEVVLEEDSLAAGIHIFSLQDHATTLAENVLYEWTVSLVCDPYNPSSNQTIGGVIKYQKDTALAEAVNSSAKQMANLYQQKKVGWYDAVHAVSNQITTDPSLRTVRANLSKQEKLDAIAAFDN
ncbi:DUF928 domain-containing protein [Candidatus Albibeggiatoa sp. nov. NOAA]|uniref:DUF928 domain-containing protein n=1 Tax=Candidatus Albibeggiatoa sp. nov. NOAA TaxID=3162724 RepID=UPI003304754F|nr:DUF928 domain-containing protein [Thiotrichaceae bacterium]